MLIGKKIYLRELKVEDASKEYCSWLNDSEVVKGLMTKRATIKGIKKYIKEKMGNKDCLFFGIFIKDSDQHAGNIKLEPIDFTNKRACIGIMVGRKYWNKRIGTEVIELFTEYAFEELGMDEVYLGTVSENKGAIKCYMNAGYKITKTIPNAATYGDIVCDAISMAKMKFPKKGNRTNKKVICRDD